MQAHVKSSQPSRILTGMAFCLIASMLPGLGVASDAGDEVIAEGERLVHNLDCRACHSPKVFTDKGPRPDPARHLSGHPAGEELPPIPEGVVGPSGWGGLFSNHLTAWAGPWGVSFARNLTPDAETGLGDWSEELFVESLRSGMNAAETRPFLPPMPTYGRLSDQELHSIFEYLQSIKPIANEVPAAVPPPQASP